MAQENPLRPWLEEQANQIEQLCRAHHLWVRVQGGTVTPRLVRFQLVIDSAIPIKRLTALQEDLALALKVPSARISRHEGVLALEIPRPQPATVPLVRIQAGLPTLPPLTALLGRDADGSPLLLRLTAPEVAHCLIAGTTGSGKTALARTLLTSLALANDPDDLRFLLVDPKGRGLAPFTGLSHLAAPPLTDPVQVEQRLGWLVEEMEWRERANVRNPCVVVAVDEVADLLTASPLSGELLTRLATRGREAGLHLVLCTQKPSAESIGTLLRANLPCRLVGRVTSAQEAVLAAGIKGTGAEKLLGRGDFLLVASGETVRFQAAYVATKEITTMVEMIQGEMDERRQPPVELDEPEPAPRPAVRKAGKVIPFPPKWVARVANALGR